MKVPSLKRMPSHSPSAGQSAAVAFVSGPRSGEKALAPEPCDSDFEMTGRDRKKRVSALAVGTPYPFDEGRI